MINRFILGCILLVFWIGLTQSFDFFDLFIGVFVSSLSIAFSLRLSSTSDFFHPSISKKFFKYVLALIPNIFIAGIKSVYMLITQKIEVKIIEVHTNLENDFYIFILAMSITLTPGTITIHKEGNTLYVLRLFPTSSDYREESETIKYPFEKILLED